MMTSLLRRIALLSMVGFLTSSCGGGGGGSDVASGGISGTGIGVGEITGFGSIIVNGTHYGTAGARRIVDDVEQDPAKPDDGDLYDDGVFKRGMVAAVLAADSGNGPEASLVVVEEVVNGLVTAPAAADGSSIEVLKQTVIVEPGKTVIDNSIPGQDIKQLQEGIDSVEVYGYVKDNGVIVATRIELELAPVKYTLRGFVKAPAADPALAGTVLEIGALTVDFSGANTGDMPPNRADWIGLLVEVDSEPPLFAGNTLTASKIEPEGLPQGMDLGAVDKAEFEGYVTAIINLNPLCDPTDGKPVDGGQFVLGGVQTVTTSRDTIYEDGICTEVVEGAKIEVEVTVGPDLIAEKVKFKESIKLESDVKVVSIATSSFELDGLPGIVVEVAGHTEFKDVTPADLTGISEGDHLRVRGRVTSVAAGIVTVSATLVEKRSASTDVVLQGPVDAASDPNVVILGISVDTSGFGFNEFEGLDDAPIGRGAFFDAVNASLSAVPPVPIEVKAQGALNGVAVIWDEIELED